MSFRCKGVTHCEICGKVLKMDEIGICKECEKPHSFLKLKEKIHEILDENAFIRAYQLIIDEYFDAILNAEKER